MTILFAGGELGSFTPSDSTVIETTADGFGGWDPNYARCGINLQAGVSSALSALWTSTNAIWLHMNLGQLAAFAGPYTFLEVFSGGTVVFKMTVDTTGTYRMYYWTGTAFVQVGNGFTIPFANTQTFDIQLSNAAINCYVAGTAKDGGTGAFTGVTAMTQLQLFPINDYFVFSEVIVADQPTLGYRLQTIAPTGNGATQQWNGSYTNINEIVTNDGSFVSTAAAGNVQLFSHSTVTTQSIRAVVVTARAATVAGAPQHMQLAVSSNSVVGLSGSVAQTTAFQPNVGVFATDPNTGAAWTNAAANAAQFGVKSLG